MARRRPASFVSRLSVVTSFALALAGCAAPGPFASDISLRGGPLRPVADDTARFVAFDASPFPFHGTAPGAARPFMDVNDNGRLGHSSLRNGVLYEDQTYNDRRSLIFLPRGFDPRRPVLLVVFLHGNEATLERDVRDRQGVVRQLAQSGLNAALIAPQLAVNAKDSSAGRFWEPNFFHNYLREAAGHLAEIYGSRAITPVLDRAPVVLVAYSGGYLPAAAALRYGGANGRVHGVVLLDALYGEADTFDAFVRSHRAGVFVSAYSRSSRDGNVGLQARVAAEGIPVSSALPETIAPGTVSFIDSGDITHGDFVTQAFTRDPLAAILSRIPGYPIGSDRPVASAASVLQ